MKRLKARWSSARAWIWSYTKWGFLALIAAGVIIFALWKIPEWQARAYHGRLDAGAISKLTPQELIQLQKDLITAENNARTTVAQILGGVALLLGLYATFKNVRVAEEGKLTERFSKAVELLGSDKIDVRLGGVYALERIARDSQKDHWTVIEVLTAFVREQSISHYAHYVESLKTSSLSVELYEGALALREDIQAALTVIGRRKWADRERPHQEINLMGAYLGKATLLEANLRGANLFQAKLAQSIFYKVDLRNAVLTDAILVKADLSYANLDGAQFDGADLTGADLRTSTGLTWRQISKARMNHTTKLASKLEERRRLDFMEKSITVSIDE